jgi:branched-subunit amino acid aminotransferase/4-amino-4-deoxychorismate lyase
VFAQLTKLHTFLLQRLLVLTLTLQRLSLCGFQQSMSRAAQGGTGEAKCGGNYAASLIAQKAAAKEGCDQVVWIDAKERKMG